VATAVSLPLGLGLLALLVAAAGVPRLSQGADVARAEGPQAEG
jgi:hypothetical protein